MTRVVIDFCEPDWLAQVQAARASGAPVLLVNVCKWVDAAGPA